MDNAINIEKFSTYDEEKVLHLLKEAELPIEDLTNAKMRNFMVAKGKDDCIIGVVGMDIRYISEMLLEKLIVGNL